MYKNVFFQHTINEIGGIETFLYEMAKKYHKKYDITIFYIRSDEKQLKRLKRYVRCIKWDGQEVECDNMFFNYTLKPMIDHVHAKHMYEVVHADYKMLKGIDAHLDDRLDGYIAVSERVKDSFYEVTGVECMVCANPLTYDKEPDPLFLVSAQRMTNEKGGKRVKGLIQKLDQSGIKYYWLIFTNTKERSVSPNAIYMPTRLDIRPFIQASDIFVALSDTEGRSYSIAEKLASGSGKLLITPCPSFYEQGCNEENSIILKFDMSNIDDVVESVRAIYEKNKPQKSFTAVKVNDKWDELFAEGKPDYQGMQYYHVHATDGYSRNGVYDNELGYVPSEGTKFVVDGERLEKLLHSPYGQLVVVDGKA